MRFLISILLGMSCFFSYAKETPTHFQIIGNQGVMTNFEAEVSKKYVLIDLACST